MFCYFFFFFFFSSRRRHTRCSRDWSSDVCSSDLEPLAEQCFERGNGELRRSEKDHAHSELARRLRRHVFHVPGLPLARLLPRSEERRVGKECRSRWEPEHDKKKREGKMMEDVDER